MPAPSISLDILDVNQRRALAPSSPGFISISISTQHITAFSKILLRYKYNTHTSSQGTAFLTFIRSLVVVQKHNLEASHISSSSLGSIKKFIRFQHVALVQGQVNIHSLCKADTSCSLFSSTRALFSMDSREIIP